MADEQTGEHLDDAISAHVRPEDYTRAHRQEYENQLPAPARCPECVQGKHDNCDGTTWDDETDALTECPCYADGHTN